MPKPRTITIEITDEKDFTVREEDRLCIGLCWDEMLGTIAELTHPKIGQARYRMQTQEQWDADKAKHEARMEELRRQSEGKKLLPRPIDFEFVEIPKP